MHIFETGQRVDFLKFLPDGERLLVSSARTSQKSQLEIWHPLSGESVPFDVPGDRDGAALPLYSPNQVAFSTNGELCYVVWKHKFYVLETATGLRREIPGGQLVNLLPSQIAISPDRKQLKILCHNYGVKPHQLLTVEAASLKLLNQNELRDTWPMLAPYLPDGKTFVTIDEDRVAVRQSQDDEVIAECSYPANSSNMPVLSPDGQTLAVAGYSSLYFFDLQTLAKPRRITTKQSGGDYRSYAFHPDGQHFALIFTGPTLIKLFDLKHLKLQHKLNWRIGKLTSIDFSPTGAVAAAGSEDGKIVVWDVD